MKLGEFYSKITSASYQALFVEFDYEGLTYRLEFDLARDGMLPASYVWLDGEPIELGTPLVCVSNCQPRNPTGDQHLRLE
jgi:hypothetical protein